MSKINLEKLKDALESLRVEFEVEADVAEAKADYEHSYYADVLAEGVQLALEVVEFHELEFDSTETTRH